MGFVEKGYLTRLEIEDFYSTPNN